MTYKNTQEEINIYYQVTVGRENKRENQEDEKWMEKEINQTERGPGEKQNHNKGRKEYKVLRKRKHNKMKTDSRAKKAVLLKIRYGITLIFLRLETQ